MTVQDVNMATALSNEYDSVEIGSLSKGSVTDAIDGATADTMSFEIDCSGYNSVLVQAYSLTGAWEVRVHGSLVSGSYYTPLAGASSGLLAEGTMFVVKGIPDYVKLEAVSRAPGEVSVRVQPLNI